MLPRPLLTAIVQTCADTPLSAIQKATGLLGASGDADALASMHLLSGVLSKESVTSLRKALKPTSLTAKELALTLSATIAGIEAGRSAPDIHLVWTGPDTASPSPRDTLPQMLEMIGRARQRILVVTYAAFKVKPLMEALLEANRRGVDLMIVVETADDSAGQLTHAAWKAFPAQLLRKGCVWHWPLEFRQKNSAGLPGKLHAKCLVIDASEVLVSSANLTNDAMERNIELGLRCTCDSTAEQIARAFDGLADRGILKRVSQ